MSSYQLRNTKRATQSNSAYDDNHIYVNIDINSLTSPPSTENTTLATANVSKSIPIVMQAEHYHMIVDRFELNGRMLPLFIWNPLETYTVRIVTAAGVNFDVDLIYVNYQGLTPLDIGYYYVYTFNHMVDMINNALKTAAVNAAIGSVPWIQWDSEAQRFSIWGSRLEFSQTFVLNAARIGFSTSLYKLFPAWTYDHTPGSDFYLVRFIERYNNVYYYNTPAGAAEGLVLSTLPSTTTAYLVMKIEDEFSVVDKWNPIDSIIFVSNKISLKETFASINNIDQSNTNAGTLAILTDFKLDVSNSGDQRKTLIYNPQQYRKIDLYSSAPINTIDIAVYFTDKETNQLNPIRIFEGDKISIKLLFEKKEIFTI